MDICHVTRLIEKSCACTPTTHADYAEERTCDLMGVYEMESNKGSISLPACLSLEGPMNKILGTD